MSTATPEPSGDQHDHGGHEHTHDGGEHGHVHAEVLPEPSGAGTVMLDIGVGRGALAVRTPPDLDGQEIEIRPADGEWLGEHKAVRPRPLASGTLYVAMFDTLPPGRYVLRVRFGPDDGVEVDAEVDEARVREVRWPGA